MSINQTFSSSPITPTYLDFIDRPNSSKGDYRDRRDTLGSAGSNLSVGSNSFSSLAVRMAIDAIKTPPADFISQGLVDQFLRNFDYTEEEPFFKQPSKTITPVMVTPIPKSGHNSLNSSSEGSAFSTKTQMHQETPSYKRQCTTQPNFKTPSNNFFKIQRNFCFIVPCKFSTDVGDVEILQQLSIEGVFGIIYKVQLIFRDTGISKICALKVNKETKKPIYKESLRIEANVLKKITELDENNEMPIVRYITDIDFGDRHGLLSSLHGDNLYTLIKNSNEKGLPLSKVYAFANEMIKGLQFLSSTKARIVHCDLKPENILRDSNDNDKLRIIDFGLSKTIPLEESSLPADYVVSRYYRAPELAFKGRYDEKIDAWSLGCILFEIATSEPLFPAYDEKMLKKMHYEFLGLIPENSVKKINIPSTEIVEDEIRKGFFKLSTYLKSSSYLSRIPRRSYFESKLKRSNLHLNHNEDKNLGVSQNSYNLFAEFVESFLKWDPSDRMSYEDALKHPFMISMNELIELSESSI